MGLLYSSRENGAERTHLAQVTDNVLAQRSSRWKVLAAAYLATFTFGVTLQSVPPVLSLLIEDFDLTHAEAGLTMSLFALPMVFLSIPAGLLADRYGPRRVGLVAFVVTIAGGLMVASSPTFPLLLAGRALAGIGALTRCSSPLRSSPTGSWARSWG